MDVPFPLAASRRLINFLIFHISMFFSASFAWAALMLGGDGVRPGVSEEPCSSSWERGFCQFTRHAREWKRWLWSGSRREPGRMRTSKPVKSFGPAPCRVIFIQALWGREDKKVGPAGCWHKQHHHLASWLRPVARWAASPPPCLHTDPRRCRTVRSSRSRRPL